MCAAYDCKIDGEKRKIVSVHTLPILLLIDELDQHTLIELSSMWFKYLEKQITNVKDFKDNYIKLIQTNGEYDIVV